MALHNHILLNARVTNPPKDTDQARAWLGQLVKDIGMKVVQGPFASYVDVPGNRGLTAAVMIETSHIAFHVWDEEDPGLLQFDLYTCSTLPVSTVVESINTYMGMISYRYLVYERAGAFNLVEEKTVE